MTSKILPLLAGVALSAAVAGAQTIIIDDAGPYDTNLGGFAMPAGSLASVIGAGGFDFQFNLTAIGTGVNPLANRVMIFSTGTGDTAQGFGINFDFEFDATTSTYSIPKLWARPLIHLGGPILTGIPDGSLIQGNVVFDILNGLANVTITVPGVGSVAFANTSPIDFSASPSTQMGEFVAFRGDRLGTVSNLLVTYNPAVPEPSAAGLIGIGAFGVLGLRRRRA